MVKERKPKHQDLKTTKKDWTEKKGGFQSPRDGVNVTSVASVMLLGLRDGLFFLSSIAATLVGVR